MINKGMIENSEEIETCGICYESLVDRKIGCIDTCLHTFCLKCIKLWIEYKLYPSCPFDRRRFQKINVKNTFNGSIIYTIEVIKIEFVEYIYNFTTFFDWLYAEPQFTLQRYLKVWDWVNQCISDIRGLSQSETIITYFVVSNNVPISITKILELLNNVKQACKLVLQEAIEEEVEENQ